MRPTKMFTFAGLAVATALAGCSNGQSSNLITSSVAKPQPAKMAIDPTCVRLTSQINALRQEGTPARVHKVAAGKSKTAVVKRASLAKVAELDRLNSLFQMKCSKYPGVQSAAAPAAHTMQAKPAVQAQQPVKPSTIAASKPIVAVPTR